MKSIMLCMILALQLSFTGSGWKAGQQVKEEPKKLETIPTPLVFVLEQLGEKYDCYFTVEQAWEDRQAVNWLEAFSVKVPVPKERGATPERRTVEQELQQFGIPGITFESVTSDVKVIHVIDKRLINLPDYALNKQIRALSFEGTSGEFLERLGALGFPVASQRAFVIGGPPPLLDVFSSVKLHEFTGTLRQGLTVAMPLRGYRRVVWVATTRLKMPKLETSIAYRGKAEKKITQ